MSGEKSKLKTEFYISTCLKEFVISKNSPLNCFNPVNNKKEEFISSRTANEDIKLNHLLLQLQNMLNKNITVK